MTASNGPAGGSVAEPTTNVNRSSSPRSRALSCALASMPLERSSAVTGWPSSAASSDSAPVPAPASSTRGRRVGERFAEGLAPRGSLERVRDRVGLRLVVGVRIRIPEVTDPVVDVGHQNSALARRRRYSGTSSSSSPSTANTSSIAWRASGSSDRAPSIPSSASATCPARQGASRWRACRPRSDAPSRGPRASRGSARPRHPAARASGSAEPLAAPRLGEHAPEPDTRVAVVRIDRRAPRDTSARRRQVAVELHLERLGLQASRSASVGRSRVDELVHLGLGVARR